MRNVEDNTDVAGRNGFVWWIGIVESRNDPLKLGRCQVRIGGGWHSDNRLKVPTTDLPWATACLPINNPNPYAPKEGDMVFGFFLDGNNAQQPVIFGIMPSIPLKAGNAQQAFSDGRNATELGNAPVKPDESATLYPRKLDEPTTSRLTRNDPDYPSPLIKSKTDKKSSTFELPSAYNARYPYNNAMESESGHVIEIDDTPKTERLHFYHRMGSYQEYRPDGSVQAKVVKDSYQAVDGNKNVYVKGNYTVNVDGNMLFNVKGSITAIAGSSISTKSGSSTSMVSGTTWSALAPATASMTAGGAASVTAGGKASMTAGGAATVTAGGAATVTAAGVATVTGATSFFTSKGLTTLSGSTVNILGAPVGGAAGAAAAGAAASGAVSGVDLAVDELGLDGVVTTTVEGVPVATAGVLTQSASATESFLGSTNITTFDDGSYLQSFDDGSTLSVATDGSLSSTSAFDGSTTTIFDDGSTLTSFADGTTAATNATESASFLTQLTDKATSIVQSVTDAASKVDPLKYVEETGKNLATSITQPFLQAQSVVDINYATLINPESTLKEQFNAARSIVGTGFSLYGQVAALPQLLANPQQLVSQYASPMVDNATSDFTKELNRSQIVSDIKSDLKNTIDGYTEKVKDIYSDTSKSLNNYVNKAMDDFSLESRAVASEVADNMVTLRSQGFTEAQLREIMPDVIKKYPAEFAKAYSGAPATSNEVAAQYASGGVIV